MISPVNIGSAPNDGTGDRLRDAFAKCNKPIAGYDSATHVWADADWQAAMLDFLTNNLPPGPTLPPTYESPLLDIPATTAGTPVTGTLAHGLGAVPKWIRPVFVVAATGNTMFPTVGTEIDWQGWWNSGSVTWYRVQADATNIYLVLPTWFTTADIGLTDADGNNFNAYYLKVKVYASL